jgi:spore maturation protein SpmA
MANIKLKPDELIAIRKAYHEERCTYAVLAARYNVVISTIARVVNNQSFQPKKKKKLTEEQRDMLRDFTGATTGRF